MAAHPNETLYRHAFAAVRDGDLDQLKGLLAPDVIWCEAGNPEALRGREAVLERMRGMQAAEIDFSDVELHAVLADDEHVVSLVKAKFSHGDRGLEYPVVEVMHVEDGMVTERWAFMDCAPTEVTAFFDGLG